MSARSRLRSLRSTVLAAAVPAIARPDHDSALAKATMASYLEAIDTQQELHLALAKRDRLIGHLRGALASAECDLHDARVEADDLGDRVAALEDAMDEALGEVAQEGLIAALEGDRQVAAWAQQTVEVGREAARRALTEDPYSGL